MDFWATVLGALPVLVGWRWHAVVQRNRWRRLETALEDLAGEGLARDSQALPAGDGELGTVKTQIERLVWLRAAMQQRIEHEEFSLRTVLSNMEEGVLVADERLIIRLVNPAFCEIFGVRGDCVGSSVLEVLGEPEIYRLMQSAMREGGALQRQVEMFPGKRVKQVSLHAVPMTDVKGRPGVLSVFRDVTRLQELENVRREFVANVSHELRTPLAIFQGYLENLLEMPELPEAERVEILGVLRKHSLRLNALVEDLLALARLEARREEFQWEVMDLGRCVEALLRDWRVRTQSGEVELKLESGADLPPVRMDPLRIEQVLHNLLENALKHIPSKGGSIVVCVKSEAGGVLVSVEDNGPGISPVDLPHIFERFYRADKSRVRAQGVASTGLGLSIVKHIVGHHGGEVGASSPLGRGARVWFRLPSADLQAASGAVSGERR
ncbi:MAG: hypothetical protein RLZZ399_440 [Verrucomicrobiota bacterium]|jgi:two-component system phosphate regulon sensor histidine kinase PhoR